MTVAGNFVTEIRNYLIKDDFEDWVFNKLLKQYSQVLRGRSVLLIRRVA